ncbi:hypothetical protein Pse7367_1551 [Thalassoporum mexicanum PCC 7367]|uniref:hypothetical protein n=1 Tax=Thalassoporum mexicanum TaxID=3457544 RepID=UPI00029F8DE7|nr:hypothetical protein [Pseudanabaena sp. PCC 7367]AFY69840.1 hypothetical protein Pse7367_1551 [Pseudanabaena sp. PCC 7367]
MSFAAELELTNPPSFPDAIAHTEKLLSHSDRLTDLELEKLLINLLQTSNGSRGFFVCYLTGNWQLADHPNQPIVNALTTCADSIAELLVKNLAMSTAMAITHQHQGSHEQATGSEQVARRSLHLIKLLNLPTIAQIATQLHRSATSGDGDYASFLDKWGYDQEQRKAIAVSLEMVE